MNVGRNYNDPKVLGLSKDGPRRTRIVMGNRVSEKLPGHIAIYDTSNTAQIETIRRAPPAIRGERMKIWPFCEE